MEGVRWEIVGERLEMERIGVMEGVKSLVGGREDRNDSMDDY
jgi:hypothetical protein